MGTDLMFVLVIAALELGAAAGGMRPDSAGAAVGAPPLFGVGVVAEATHPDSAGAAVGAPRADSAGAVPAFARNAPSLIPVGARVRVLFPPRAPAPSFAFQHWRGGEKEVAGDVLFANLDTLTLGVRGHDSALAIPIATTSAVYMRVGEPHHFGVVKGAILGAGVGLVLTLAMPFVLLRGTDAPNLVFVWAPVGVGTVLGAAWGGTHDGRAWEKVR
jgi:hypothetical protein